jgi:hypothetical protein
VKERDVNDDEFLPERSDVSSVSSDRSTEGKTQELMKKLNIVMEQKSQKKGIFKGKLNTEAATMADLNALEQRMTALIQAIQVKPERARRNSGLKSLRLQPE